MTTPTNLRLDDQLCFALYAATNQVTRAYRPLLESIGLTYPQYLVMLVLWESDTRPIGDIAGRLQLTPHALSPMLRRLELAGLLQREVDDADGRVVNVALTRQGRELEEAASRAQCDVVVRTGLSGKDLADLRKTLRALVVTMSTEQS
jgi:MarR family transcriptional regulator, organic hydroperoxide resistance regulator